MSDKEVSKSSINSEEKGEHIEVANVPFVKSEAEKRYLRKLNMRLLPLAGIVIFLQFVDKSVLSVSAVLGILQDTNMSLSQYSWLSALFHLGYLVFQLPNSFLIQKLPLSKYLGVLLSCWGAVTVGAAFCKNFTQLAILRVFLGVFEAGTFPVLIMIFNTLYRRSEQSACFGFLQLCNGLAAVIGASSAVGIAKLGVRGSIRAWQWGYMIWGSITIFFGILVFFFLVDGPSSWVLKLSEEEKLIVEERTRDNAVVRKQEVKVSHYWEALKEPRLWLFFVISLAHHLQNGGLVSYSTVLVKGLGFTSFNAIYLQIPSGALTVFFIAIAVTIHRKTHQTIYTAVFFYIITAIGCLLLAVLPHNGVKLLGLYLTWAQTGSYVMLLTLIGSTVSGYSKKIFYNCANMVAYTLGNFCGPLMLVEHTAPKYIPTMWGYFGAAILNMLCLIAVRFILRHINSKRASQRDDIPTDVTLNLTDKEDKNYVYKY